MRDARQDGLVNAVTGLGDDEIDLRLHTHRIPSYQRSVYEYESEWRDNAYAQREVSQVSGDIFREGLDLINVKPEAIDIGALKSWLEGDTTPNPDGSINRTEGLLNYAEKLIEQGDKVGGAALYVIVDDGLDPVHPLDWRRIQRVVAWVVLDRSEIVPYISEGMGMEPEYWMLSDVLSTAKVQGGKRQALRPGQVIHHTRLWRHKGIPLSAREERLRQFWGGSVLEVNWDARRAIEEGTTYANTYLHRASMIHVSLAELNEIYGAKDPETGQEIGTEVIDRRMRQFRRIASTLDIMLTDGGRQGSKSSDGLTEIQGRNPDKVESVVERTGDLIPIVELNRTQWQSGWGAPREIAFGEQTSALRGGDSKGAWQSWQGTIDLKRKKKRVIGLVNWMLTITFASREGPTHGLIPTQWEQQWRPLHVPSAMEKATIDKARADADNARIGTQVVTAEEVRQQRIVNGDVEGQLTVTEVPNSEKVTIVPPAHVGIAKAMLDGAMAVATGQITKEFYARYLLAIDGARFTEEEANRIADQAAAGIVPGAAAAEVTTDSASPVTAATVMASGGQVAQGKMAPEFFEEALQTLDPEQFDPETAARLRAAAEGNDPDAPALPPDAPLVAPVGAATAVAPALPTTDAATPEGQPSPAPAAPIEPKANPFAVLAEIPDDLMTPEQIVAEIKLRTPLPITTRHVHAIAKKHAVRRGKISGVTGYSAGDVATALARDNGLLPPAAEVDEPVVDESLVDGGEPEPLVE